jgi:hypothetical protein
MSTQRYSVTPHPIETLLTWVKSGEIAIPEIQRPFVWEPSKVRNLLDSLYQGYPIGYLIAWRNPNIRLKDGSISAGKKILIDGQQRVTALMAALMGKPVLTKDYETVRIRISFNPLTEKFEVANPAIQKDSAWIYDVGDVFHPEASLSELTDIYSAKNPEIDKHKVSKILENLRKIVNNLVGIIDLAEDLDIETVTEIFIRVNSAGAELSQADFAMSKIAANEAFGGHELRKAIDYFCHLSIAPDFYNKIKEGDPKFAATDYFQKMSWLRDMNDDIYDPSYTDMLRVAFTSEFRRGKLQDLVALLSGRNFETRQFEEVIAEESFAKLRKGILNFMNKTHFERFVMIMRSAGFVTSDLIGGQNAVNFAYIIYLMGRSEGMNADNIERIVRRWYVMSLITGQYSGNPETAFDLDIRQIDNQGLENYTNALINARLSESFWDTLLPQQMETSSAISPYFLVFKAAQVKLHDKGFLSRDIAVIDLLLNRSDVHHIFPRNLLKKDGLQRGRYNQIANFAITQSEINISIGDRSPVIYFQHLTEQCDGGAKKYGGITEKEEMLANFRMNCIPETMLQGEIPDYNEFLKQRRYLMAQKIKTYFELL